LVSGAPIIDVKNLAAHLLDWMRSSRALRLNRIPGIFVMIGAGAFFRPVDWLMQMPEPGGVDAGVILGASSRKNKRRHQCQGTAKNGGGYNGARFATDSEYSPLSKPPNIWRAPRRELANPFAVAPKNLGYDSFDRLRTGNACPCNQSPRCSQLFFFVQLRLHRGLNLLV
jgi:hypothetical protein